MALVEMTMPKMGESVMEATILSWLKKEGDRVSQDESVLEVATDKVDTEVPTTHGGILKKILAGKGEVVPVGKPIAIIETEEDIKHPLGLDDLPDDYQHKEVVQATRKGKLYIDTHHGINRLDKPEINKFFSPLVRSIAMKENISLDELEKLSGSGKKGRITKNDIFSFLENRNVRPGDRKKPVPESLKTQQFVSGEDEIIEMDRLRKIIAERMTESKRISAHVTSFVEADVSNVVYWRNKVKDEFFKTHGLKITYTPLFIEAVVKSIIDFPMVNISVDGDKIIKRGQINIGMAVALSGFNLIVPVIKNADRYDLVGLTRVVNDLIERARNNQLKPDELAGGTYTVTNVGSFGNVIGTPIIMQPQVAILAIGAIVKKPAVVETPYGDAIAIRHKMFLSHSYDHRVIDGALGGAFIRKVADYLELFDINRNV